jgi:hypothetical protein
MKTPAGSECEFFFGDYYRGRNHEECRLIGDAPSPNHWTPDLCKNCPVPRFRLANACQNLVFEGKVRSLIFGLKRRVEVSAYCVKSASQVKEPEVGCGLCHQLPDVFLEK